MRPIIVPRDVSILPWSAGYAETINAGKSRHNEDQAMARQGSIGVVVGGRLVNVPYTMFAVHQVDILYTVSDRDYVYRYNYCSDT